MLLEEFWVGYLFNCSLNGPDILIDLHCDEISKYVYYVPPVIKNLKKNATQFKLEKSLIKYAGINKIIGLYDIVNADDRGILVNYLPIKFNCAAVMIELPCKFDLNSNKIELLLNDIGKKLILVFKSMILKTI